MAKAKTTKAPQSQLAPEADDGLAELLRESEDQRRALREFEDQWVALARLHVGLLRDANELSARHRRTCEILESYRGETAQVYERTIVQVVDGLGGNRYTPAGTMCFNVNRGWHSVEDK